MQNTIQVQMIEPFLAIPVNLPEEFFEFVRNHLHDDATKLRLKFHGSDREWLPLAIEQIAGRTKATRKLGALMPRLLPVALSIEQATSERVALLHGKIACKLVGKGGIFADLTCGMGIDFLAITRAINPTLAIGIEQNKELAEINAFNYADIDSIRILATDSTKWIKVLPDSCIELIFVDPARRSSDGGRVYDIHQCTPDLISIMPDLKRIGKALMVKLSPMLDVSETLNQLPGIKELYIIDDAGECRELLATFDFKETATNDPIIKIISPEGSFEFRLSEEREATADFGVPEKGVWLFEPSPATMKAGCFNLLSQKLGLKKLHPNTHLYFSDSPIEGLPGKWYPICEVFDFSSSLLKNLHKEILRADVATRNFPLAASDLQKRLKIKAGGETRLIGCTCGREANHGFLPDGHADKGKNLHLILALKK